MNRGYATFISLSLLSGVFVLAPPYTLPRKSPITGAWGNVTTGIGGTSTTDTISATEAYYRIVN